MSSHFEPGGHMNRKIFVPVIMSAFLLVTACSHKKDEKKQESMDPVASYSTPVTQEGLDKMTEEWPEPSKAAINSLTAKYGLPAAVTEEMVVWNDTGSFKRSIVYKEQVDHQFPIQHSDVLVQTVNYRVPLDKVERVSKFSGSILIDRTKGELSARNDKEEMNILALNLADKIIRGEKTVEQARREYSKNAEAFAAGTSNNLMSSLNFDSKGNTSDPDTMMQSQSEKQPVMRKTIEAEEVEKVIVE
jgi:hypothetical protein